MNRVPILFTCLLIITGLANLTVDAMYLPNTVVTPTAPPPPRITNTLAPTSRTRVTQRPTNTRTSSIHSGGWPTRTPTQTSTPTDTPTLAATATLTPTLTPTFTPTPFFNLHVTVYLDMNRNKLFDFGEGVSDLLLLASAGSWSVQAMLKNGEAWLVLPPDIPPRSDVQVQAPYLHWSDMLRAPKPGEILEASLRLGQTQFPVSLP